MPANDSSQSETDRRIYEALYDHQPVGCLRPMLPPDIIERGKTSLIGKIRECPNALSDWAYMGDGEIADAVLRHAQRLIDENPPYTVTVNDDSDPCAMYERVTVLYKGEARTGIIVGAFYGTIYIDWLSAEDGKTDLESAKGLTKVRFLLNDIFGPRCERWQRQSGREPAQCHAPATHRLTIVYADNGDLPDFLKDHEPVTLTLCDDCAEEYREHNSYRILSDEALQIDTRPGDAPGIQNAASEIKRQRENGYTCLFSKCTERPTYQLRIWGRDPETDRVGRMIERYCGEHIETARAYYNQSGAEILDEHKIEMLEFESDAGTPRFIVIHHYEENHIVAHALSSEWTPDAVHRALIEAGYGNRIRSRTIGNPGEILFNLTSSETVCVQSSPECDLATCARPATTRMVFQFDENEYHYCDEHAGWQRDLCEMSGVAVITNEPIGAQGDIVTETAA